MTVQSHEKLVVLDFGSQVTQLIARRVRELGVYAEILPYDVGVEYLKKEAPLGLILSGGPSSIYDEGAPELDPAVLELGVPVLGICYGMFAMVSAIGGKVAPAKVREFGDAQLVIDDAVGPLATFATGEPCTMMSVSPRPISSIFSFTASIP